MNFFVGCFLFWPALIRQIWRRNHFEHRTTNNLFTDKNWLLLHFDFFYTYMLLWYSIFLILCWALHTIMGRAGADTKQHEKIQLPAWLVHFTFYSRVQQHSGSRDFTLNGKKRSIEIIKSHKSDPPSVWQPHHRSELFNFHKCSFHICRTDWVKPQEYHRHPSDAIWMRDLRVI